MPPPPVYTGPSSPHHRSPGVDVQLLPCLPRPTSRRRLVPLLVVAAACSFVLLGLRTIVHGPGAEVRGGGGGIAGWVEVAFDDDEDQSFGGGLAPTGPADAVIRGRKVYDDEGHELWNLPDRLLPSEPYLITGHVAGWTNQYMGTVHSIHLALLTNRTPIIPYYRGYASQLGESLVTLPLPNLAFSEVFDLPRLFDSLRSTPASEGLRGIVDVAEILEINRDQGNGGRGWPAWHPLDEGGAVRVEFGGGWKDLERERWELGCWGAYKEGLRHPLFEARIEPIFTRLPYDAMPHDRSLAVQRPLWNGLQKYLAAEPADGVIDRALEALDPSERGGVPPSGWIACVDSIYWATSTPSQWPWDSWHTPLRPSPQNSDVPPSRGTVPAIGPDAAGPWETVGQYVRWVPELERRGIALVRRVFGVAEGRKLPPFISVHIRRSDFLQRCDLSRDSCFSLAAFHLAVDTVRELLRLEKRATVDHVLFTTDETDPAFLEMAAELGWKRVEVDESLEIRQTYGDWYPMLLDNVLLSLGKGFVGTKDSTMSLVNGRRVEYWNDGLATYIDQHAPEA